MNNSKHSLEINKVDSNEKKETIISIDEVPTVNKVFLDSQKKIEQIMENNKNIDKEVLFSVENETRDKVPIKVDEEDKQGKMPDVWVQYHKVFEENHSPSKQIVPERPTGHEEKNYQHNDNSGGGGLDYDPESRNSFLLLVFTILLITLALTAIYVVIVLNSPDLTDFYIVHRKGLFFLSAGVMIAMSYAMICCLPIVRTTPCNYIVLIIAVLMMSNMAAVCTVAIKSEIILFALLGTCITVGVCLLLALSRFDFTAWYLYLVVIMVVFAVLSLGVTVASLAFGFKFKPLHLALLYIGTLIQVIILIVELQMIIGGKSIEMSESEYVLAAYMLYTSIVNLFLQILAILTDMNG